MLTSHCESYECSCWLIIWHSSKHSTKINHVFEIVHLIQDKPEFSTLPSPQSLSWRPHFSWSLFVPFWRQRKFPPFFLLKRAKKEYILKIPCQTSHHYPSSSKNRCHASGGGGGGGKEEEEEKEEEYSQLKLEEEFIHNLFSTTAKKALSRNADFIFEFAEIKKEPKIHTNWLLWTSHF